jgi:hypothetical protein
LAGTTWYFTGTIQYLSAKEDDYDESLYCEVRFKNRLQEEVGTRILGLSVKRDFEFQTMAFSGPAFRL